MKVLLKEDVKTLGVAGSMVSVAPGYARNYLIPKGLAIEASTKNIRRFEHEKNVILEKARKAKREVEELASQLSGIKVTIEAQAGEEDKLFGSVTSMDIAEALSKQGIKIDKRKILIEEPIKRLGTYIVSIKLHPEMTISVSVEVKKSNF